MKIALVSPYDFIHPGGVVNHILALYDQLREMGHEVRIIAPASRSVQNEDERFLHIGKARPLPVRGTTIRISLSLRLASKIKEVLSRENFDIIHLHEPFMPMLCSAVLRFSDSVNIGTFHACRGSPGYNFGWPISKLMLCRRRRKLAGKIAVSKTAMDYASEHVPGQYTIIPKGIDLEHFSPDVLPIERFADGKINILFVGRLEKRKGLDHLLKAYHKVKKEHANCRLIVVGPGVRFRRKYEIYVRRHRLADVVFVGMVEYDELPRYYKTADIFCSPATGRESFGIVLLEAMALGKPVVATSIEGYAGVMTDGKEGYLVSPKDDKELARSLMALINDESLRQQMGARGLITAREHDWKMIARRVADYYTEMLIQTSRHKSPLKYEALSVLV
ncbi:MAG: glycosyltransferase family 4 protein [Dehalococcoidales bacterium]|nr:glycosyltransferase family 4 protein [Dehalococcoidales bacterium]